MDRAAQVTVWNKQRDFNSGNRKYNIEGGKLACCGPAGTQFLCGCNVAADGPDTATNIATKRISRTEATKS